MKKTILLLTLSLLCLTSYAQLLSKEQAIVLKTSTGDIYGTLRVPISNVKVPIAILIAGSGPTDRDGNQPNMKNNSLKMLADALYQNNIATLCFDKRGIGQSKLAGMKESELRFEDYVNDVRGWATLLSQDNRFLSVSIIGHSEGALIGLIASKNNTKISKYISIAGLGEPASKILKKQLDKQLIGQPQALRDQVSFCIDQLEQGKQIENVPVSLNTLFRPSVQPYMISWFRYNPQKEIAELSIPILIVQGTMDIQVSVEQSELLVMGNKKAEKVIIDNMDHVMKNSKSKDTQSQLIGSYNNPTSSLNGDLVKNVVEFLKK